MRSVWWWPRRGTTRGDRRRSAEAVWSARRGGPDRGEFHVVRPPRRSRTSSRPAVAVVHRPSPRQLLDLTRRTLHRKSAAAPPVSVTPSRVRPRRRAAERGRSRSGPGAGLEQRLSPVGKRSPGPGRDARLVGAHRHQPRDDEHAAGELDGVGSSRARARRRGPRRGPRSARRTTPPWRRASARPRCRSRRRTRRPRGR